MSWDALEVLRGDNRCAGATDDDEWTSVLTTANPFPEGCTGQNDGCAWQVDGYAGDPDNEGVVWPRIAEISLLGALGCGRYLAR